MSAALTAAAIAARAACPDDAIRCSFPCRTVSPNGGTGNSRAAGIAKTKRVMAHRKQANANAWSTRRVGQVRLLMADGADFSVLLRRVAPSNGLDDDNLRSALKAVRDGIADALGINDRDPRVSWEYDQRRGKRGEYAVEVEIRRR